MRVAEGLIAALAYRILPYVCDPSVVEVPRVRIPPRSFLLTDHLRDVMQKKECQLVTVTNELNGGK